MELTVQQQVTQEIRNTSASRTILRNIVQILSFSYVLGLFSAMVVCLTTAFVVLLPLSLLLGEQSLGEPDGERAEFSCR